MMPAGSCSPPASTLREYFNEPEHQLRRGDAGFGARRVFQRGQLRRRPVRRDIHKQRDCQHRDRLRDIPVRRLDRAAARREQAAQPGFWEMALMILNLIYDSFALAAPQSFRDGMATAANLLIGVIHDNITINIDVGYGEFNSGPLFTNQNISLGGDSGFSITYSNLRALLASHETSAADITSVNVLPNTTTLNGQSSFVIGTAEARALGALPANNGTVDGLVGMGTNFTGSVLVGGALHELTHAMGRVPGASGLSLFRYTSQGNHLFAGGTPAAASYFSIDGGVTKLADFGVSSDPSDFLNSPASNLTPNDPFDEGIAGSTLTSVDLTMMDVLGFNVTSSPPQYVFFAPGQPMNAVTTTDPNNVPPPAPGNFN